MTTILVTSNAAEVAKNLQLTAEELRRAVRETMQTTARESLRDFRRTTATWRHKPRFEAVTEERRDGFTVLVGTDDPIYGYVDQGTPEHLIFPRKPGGRLRFQWGGKGSYRAKTSPGSLSSGPGGSSGPIVYRAWVVHPGTEARNFSDIIQEYQRVESRELLAKKIRAVIARRGWRR